MAIVFVGMALSPMPAYLKTAAVAYIVGMF
jgi:hypothetical protein